MKTYYYKGRNIDSLSSLVFAITVDEEMHKYLFDQNNFKVVDTNLEQDLSGVDFYLNDHMCNSKIASTGYISIAQNYLRFENGKPMLTYPNDSYISVYYNKQICYLTALQINNGNLLKKSKFENGGAYINSYEFYHLANDFKQKLNVYGQDARYYEEQFKIYNELHKEGVKDIDVIIAKLQPLYKQYHHEEFTFEKQ